jgi:maltooligosyltrehalose trehalohydrolase
VPLIFQGEEWGASTPFLYFTDHQDPRLGRAVSEGRAREFESFCWTGEIPDPQARDSFVRSKLDWTEPARAPHAELLEWYRRLIALRAARSARMHARARPRAAYDARAEWLRFEYAGVLAVFNFAAAPQRVALPRGTWELALASDAVPGASAPDPSGTSAEIGANGTRIYLMK